MTNKKVHPIATTKKFIANETKQEITSQNVVSYL